MLQALRAFIRQQAVNCKQLRLHKAEHRIHQPVLFLNLRALTLQFIFCLYQLVFLRKLRVDFSKLCLNPIDFRNILQPVYTPVLHRRALQPRIRIQENRFARRRFQLIRREIGRVFRAVNGFSPPIHNLRGDGGFGKEIAVIAVGRYQPHLQAALPERRKRQAKAFRHLVKGVDIGEAQRAQRKSAQKYAQRYPRVSPAFRYAAFAVNDNSCRQQQSDNPRHGEIIHPSVGIIRFQRRSARHGAKNQLMQIVGQNAADEQHRRNKQQIPFARKRIALPPPQLQRGEQAEQRRKDLRHIIQIPQMARNGIVAEKSILDRAQKQPKHGHRAAQKQPSPVVSVQGSARYGKSPRHGQTDIDQIGQQKAGGRGQRRGQSIHLAKKAGKNEQPQRKAKLCNGFSLCSSHISTSRQPPETRILYHISGGKASVFKAKRTNRIPT